MAVLSQRRPLSVAAVGLVLSVALSSLVGVSVSRFWIRDADVALLLGYLAVWVPLAGAVVLAIQLELASHALSTGVRRSFLGELGVRFRPIDLLWGVAIGLLCRVVAGLLEIAAYGQLGTSAPTLGEPGYDAWWLFGALIAPVVIAPVVEEVFFRGLLLRAALGYATLRAVRRPVVAAVSVSAVAFALVHVVQASSVSAGLVVGVSTLLFGMAAGTVVAMTGRLGGAIIAHVTFNALVVVPALM